MLDHLLAVGQVVGAGGEAAVDPGRGVGHGGAAKADVVDQAQGPGAGAARVGGDLDAERGARRERLEQEGVEPAVAEREPRGPEGDVSGRAPGEVERLGQAEVGGADLEPAGGGGPAAVREAGAGRVGEADVGVQRRALAGGGDVVGEVRAVVDPGAVDAGGEAIVGGVGQRVPAEGDGAGRGGGGALDQARGDGGEGVRARDHVDRVARQADVLEDLLVRDPEDAGVGVPGAEDLDGGERRSRGQHLVQQGGQGARPQGEGQGRGGQPDRLLGAERRVVDPEQGAAVGGDGVAGGVDEADVGVACHGRGSSRVAAHPAGGRRGTVTAGRVGGRRRDRFVAWSAATRNGD